MSSRVLDVPYYVQPTHNTCQSTVLKMMSAYLEKEVVRESLGGKTISIPAIRTELATGPVNGNPLAHKNFKWWLEKRFPALGFTYAGGLNEMNATIQIVAAIDSGVPVIVSVSHARSAGHIVLVIGYEDYIPHTSSADFKIVLHDPAGRFDQHFQKAVNKYVGGMSLPSGSEFGPGFGCRLPIGSASRRREHAVPKYTLLYAHRRFSEQAIPAN